MEAFLHTGITNAGTEGNNRLIKDVKRVACGFRNPTNQRRRVRCRCTGKHRAATATSTKMPG
ncbi:transposase [Spelaeicoccus albus]|uniref:transposase n=1 Tax=Spelaeicoccus albus TaxID=1280376 RepID=UPI003CC81D8E